MIASDKELEAILKTRRMIKSGHPDMSTFIDWLADRMINVYNESPQMDFVQATRRYAKDLRDIEHLLSN